MALTTLAESYRERAVRVEEIRNIEVYTLSREDIIVTKIGRYSTKDKEDIVQMMKVANKCIIAQLIQQVIERQNLSPKVKQYFKQHVIAFRREFDV